MTSSLFSLTPRCELKGWFGYRVKNCRLCYNWRNESGLKKCTWIAINIPNSQETIFSADPIYKLPVTPDWSKVVSGACLNSQPPKTGTHFLAFDHMTHGNMFHVIFDHLYRVFLMLTHDFPIDSACFTSTSWTWAKEVITAALKGKIDIQYMSPMEVYHFESLLLLSNSFAFSRDYSLNQPPWNFHRLREYDRGFLDFLHATAIQIVEKKAPSTNNFDISPRSRIFISRDSMAKRPVAHQEALESVFIKHGFLVMTFDNLTPSEQLFLVNRATHIAGIHGAALCNLIAARPGSHVLELFTSTNNNCYQRVSEALGLNYTSAYATLGNDGWIFDINKLHKTVEKFSNC